MAESPQHEDEIPFTMCKLFESSVENAVDFRFINVQKPSMRNTSKAHFFDNGKHLTMQTV